MSWSKPIGVHQLGFVPDLPDNTPGSISDADLMYPTASGARVSPSLVVASNALPSACLGAYFSRLSAGAVNIFAGTGQHLYRLLIGFVTYGSGMTYDQFATLYKQYKNLPRLAYGDKFFQPPTPVAAPGPTWVEVDGGQSFSSQGWCFTQAGDDCIATDGNGPVQAFGASSSQFAPLAGNPPKAKFAIAVDPGAGQGIVLLLANLSTDSTGWVSSKPGDDTVWTLSVNDLSASGFLRAGPGPITGFKSVRTFAVGFKETSLYIGAFVGPPFVWNVEPVSLQVGCKSNNAIVNIGDTLAFPGPDDFYTFDGYSLNAIPNALRQWFFGEPGQSNNGIADPQYLGTIQGEYDDATGVVYWHFASVNANPKGTLDMYICWNKKSGKWLPGHTRVSAVLNRYGLPGLTYDQFCSRYSQYSNLPHLTYGDDSFGPSAVRTRAVILPDGKLYAFSGPPNSGYLQTGDLGDFIRLTRIDRVRGLFGVFPAKAANGQRALLSSYVRRNMGEGLTGFKTGVPLSDSGYFDFRESAGFHVLRIAFQSDAELQGWIVDGRDAGYR